MFGIGCQDSYFHYQAKGKCVDKKQIEDQLKGNKSIAYLFGKISSQKNKKKIKRCNTESAHLAGTGR